jgi:hypothetical protein
MCRVLCNAVFFTSFYRSVENSLMAVGLTSSFSDSLTNCVYFFVEHDTPHLKHALAKFVMLCKYLPRKGPTVYIDCPCTLCTNYDPLYAFWATGKGHTSKTHQAPHGPDLAIITPLFTLISLESPLMTILASSRSSCTHTNI